MIGSASGALLAELAGLPEPAAHRSLARAERVGQAAFSRAIALKELGQRCRDPVRIREGIRHLTTEPYRPRTNGKVERFHQTMAREWAYGLAYRSHRQRSEALPHWLEHYNRRRPHSSLGDRPPISRVHNVRG